MLNVLKITRDILELPNAHLDGDVDVNLQKAIDYLNLYLDSQEEVFQRRLQSVRNMVKNWLAECGDDTIEYKQYREDNFEYFNFNEEYIFKINTIKNVDKLIGFIEFVMNSYVPQPSETTAPVEKEAPQQLPDPIVTQAAISETTIDTNTITQSVEEEEYIAPTPEEIAEQKRKNVEHMERVRRDMDVIAESNRKKILKERSDEVAHTLSDRYDVVQRIVNPIKNVLVENANSMKIQLNDIINELRVKYLIEEDTALLRAMIKVVSINLRNRFKDIPTVVVDKDYQNIITPHHAKIKLFHVAIANLDLVKLHESIRPYSLFELIIYMTDYASRTNSIIIADTPEDIVSLASGIYDIFVTHGLRKEFVYSSSEDNVDVQAIDTWYLQNPILSHYLDMIPSSKVPAKEGVSEILEVFSNRNVLMSQQQLDQGKIDVVKIALDKIFNDTDSGSFIAYYEEMNTYLLIASKIGSFSKVVIVLDSMGVVSFNIFNDNKRYQKTYTPVDAAELSRWFNNIFNPTKVTITQPEGSIYVKS